MSLHIQQVLRGPRGLPAELWVAVLQHLPLDAVLAVATTCRQFLHIATTELGAWTCLDAAAVEAGVHVSHHPSADGSGHEVAMRRTLATLAGSVYSPPPFAWARLLPVLSRSFVLYELEHPRLAEELWEATLRARFAPSLVERSIEDSCGARGRRNKERFLRTLARLDHRADTNCGQEEHMVGRRHVQLTDLGYT